MALFLALELAEWDRFRVLMEAGEAASPNLDVFIEDGALCYQRSLAVLHDGQLHSSPRETKRWMKFSRKQRKAVSRDTGLIDGSKDVEMTEERLAYLDTSEPERSYSGERGRALLGAAQVDAEQVTGDQPQ